MSFDKKKLPPQADWASEQETFGSQSPYASTASVPYASEPLPPTAPTGPSAPYPVPADAPPMYTEDPIIKPSAPLSPRHPQGFPTSSTPYLPQQQPQPQQHQYQQPPPSQYQPPIPPPQVNHAYHPPQGPPPSQQPQYQQHMPVPQHNQPQQYHPSAINYGATANPNTRYYPAPRGPPNDSCSSDEERPIRRRHKKKKKTSSCCSCCCLTIIFIVLMCWYFGGSIEFSDGSCYISDDSASRTSSQTLSASQDLALKFEIIDGLSGNINVKESESWSDQDVRIRTVMRASTSELLRELEQSFTNNKESARVWVHIKDSNDKETKKRLTRQGCARADVEIIYPRARPGTGKLDLSSINGEINVQLNNHTTAGAKGLASFEELQISLKNGDVNLDKTIVSNKLSAEVVNGHVSGTISTAGNVYSRIINGYIDLSIDTTLRRDDWDVNNFKVSMSTVNGRIAVKLVKRFLGHFTLSSAIGKPNLRLPSSSTDVIKYISRTGYEVKGWISENNEEPKTSSQLDLKTVNGNILVEVETEKNN
ncbi:hypothetical protein BGZ46_008304 [Entomortierella lignicola]|nr:hypothetical protein BGZ46_008304 [Entomortierella lignicola]